MDQSVTNQHANNAQRYDIFFYLPDHIIYEILSHLTADEVGKFALLSKRCGQLFVSRPCLKFECICLPDDPSCLCNKFIDYVDRTLSQQNGLTMLSFYLKWDCYNSNSDRKRDCVDKWTNIAASRQVRKLDLEVSLRHDGDLLSMPNCFVSSRFLRVLKLHFTWNFLEEPTGVLAYLEELSLCKLTVIDECLEKWISACPSLKRLTISEIADEIDHVRIASKSLEELDMFDLPSDIKSIDISTDRLQKLSLDLDMHPEQGGTLKVRAPNLQYLCLEGEADVIYLSEWKFLKKATLYLDFDNGNIQEETICTRLAELLRCVRHVTVLEIDCNIFQVLLRCKQPLVQLNNLRHFDITVDAILSDGYLPVFASEVTVSPKLKTVFFERSENKYQMHSETDPEMMASEFYRPDKRLDQIGDQLSAIEIELKGNIDEVKSAVEYLVEFAKGLKKITIFSSRENLEMLPKTWADDLKRVSLHLEVNFVEKRFPINEDPWLRVV